MQLSEDMIFILFMIIGIAVGMIIMWFVLSNRRYKTIGTMIIDMKDKSRDICRFVLDTDLETISKYSKVAVKIQLSDRPLESFKDYD